MTPLHTLALWFWVQFAAAQSASSPSAAVASPTTSSSPVSVVTGNVTTYTTELGFGHVMEGICSDGYISSELNGYKYEASYGVWDGDVSFSPSYQDPNAQYYSTLWYFRFDEQVHATGFEVEFYGAPVFNNSAYVNLEQGAFTAWYIVAFPRDTMDDSVAEFCASDYVRFVWTMIDPETGSEQTYKLYQGSTGAQTAIDFDESNCAVDASGNCQTFADQLTYNCTNLWARGYWSCSGEVIPFQHTISSSSSSSTSEASSTSSEVSSTSSVASSSSSSDSISSSDSSSSPSESSSSSSESSSSSAASSSSYADSISSSGAPSSSAEVSSSSDPASSSAESSDIGASSSAESSSAAASSSDESSTTPAFSASSETLSSEYTASEAGSDGSSTTDMISVISSSESSGEVITDSTTITVVPESTTVITITSCSDNACETKAVTTGVTVVTTTSSGVETVYTTYCPLTGETGAPAGPSTTVITITSCSDDACETKAVTTGVTVFTSTSAGVETEYTTYCPLTSTEAPEDTTETVTTIDTSVVPSESDTDSFTETEACTETTEGIATFEGVAASFSKGVFMSLISVIAAALLI